MKDFVDASAFNTEQGNRARKLFAAVVLAALDDAIADDRKYGNGPEQIARWARSRDGREVLSCAGIDPNERVVSGLMEFVAKGVRTSVALSREESERRSAASDHAEAAHGGSPSLALLCPPGWLQPRAGAGAAHTRGFTGELCFSFLKILELFFIVKNGLYMLENLKQNVVPHNCC